MIKDANEHLNNILQFLFDSTDCYKENMNKVSDNKLKNLFEQLSQQRSKMIDEIKSEIKKVGGTAKESRTVIGKVHEFYEHLKSLITNNDPLVLIKEIKRGENMLVECYKEALNNNLSEETKTLLLKHLNQIEDGLKQIDISAVTDK